MRITSLTRDEFFQRFEHHAEATLKQLARPEAIIVKKFLRPEQALEIRAQAFRAGQSSEPSWHPLNDDCPDYHRLHDNYPTAWVKQKLHGFYYHGRKLENRALMAPFLPLLHLKNRLGGFDPGEHIDNRPSEGAVSRLNIHHDPRGGGYQAEHIDPSGPFARIQTLVIASRFGSDFRAGAVYARAADGHSDHPHEDAVKPVQVDA